MHNYLFVYPTKDSQRDLNPPLFSSSKALTSYVSTCYRTIEAHLYFKGLSTVSLPLTEKLLISSAALTLDLPLTYL